jgi:hypothetical protein
MGRIYTVVVRAIVEKRVKKTIVIISTRPVRQFGKTRKGE